MGFVDVMVRLSEAGLGERVIWLSLFTVLTNPPSEKQPGFSIFIESIIHPESESTVESLTKRNLK